MVILKNCAVKYPVKEPLIKTTVKITGLNEWIPTGSANIGIVLCEHKDYYSHYLYVQCLSCLNMLMVKTFLVLLYSVHFMFGNLMLYSENRKNYSASMSDHLTIPASAQAIPSPTKSKDGVLNT